MNIKQNLVNSNKYSRKCPYGMNPIGISIHNTYNDASAKNEVSYMHSNNNQVSFHIAIDDIEAIQGLPLDRNSWSCGDGSSGNGNRKHISIEICYSKSGGSKFTNAEKLAAKVVAELLKKYNWGIDKVKAHRDFANKNCPHRTNMNEFKKLVQQELNKLNTSTNKKYKNCILYNNEIDKTTAEVLSWGKTDYIIKNVKDHVAWEGYNLFTIGGGTKEEFLKMKTGEKCTFLDGKNRFETLDLVLKHLGK